jgi:hypothetical protein
MTKTIVWIRHGCVYPYPNHDVLTKEGELFASRLPKLLREHSIEPDVVFFDESPDSPRGEGDPNHTLGKPKRCCETVRAFEVPSKVYFTCSTHAEAEQRLIKFASKGQVIVVCYKTESFFKFPPIKESAFEKYMNNNSKPQEKSVYDKLYDEMLVTTFDGANLILQKTIPTGMRSTSISAEDRS